MGMSAFRHELKYLISCSERDELIRRIQAQGMLQADPHAVDGSYFIRSLYFDDYRESAYEEKQMGIATRHKYRIRFYDFDDSVIHLEKKIKQGSYIRKESAPLTRKETEAILTGEYAFLLHRPEALCKEFYVSCMSELLRPAVLVDYDRAPYILHAGTVRVTFDNHIRAGIGGTDLFDTTLPTLETMEEGTLIMEVKYTEFLPEFVRMLLPNSAQLTQASKYVSCYELLKQTR